MEGAGRGPHRSRGGAKANSGAGTCSLAESDFLLQWGNRKRLRCVKIQVRTAAAAEKPTARADRRVVGSDKDPPPSTNLLRRESPLGILRSSYMRSPQRHANGFGHATSPERDGATAIYNSRNSSRAAAAGGCYNSSEDKKGGGGSSSGSEGMVWPKFVIALTNKEKEEDFFLFRGCNKLPQRPKKRAKCIQKTLNMVSPGTWLSDLTQERYEVREKKVAKKKPNGLKAMGSMESDSD